MSTSAAQAAATIGRDARARLPASRRRSRRPRPAAAAARRSGRAPRRPTGSRDSSPTTVHRRRRFRPATTRPSAPRHPGGGGRWLPRLPTPGRRPVRTAPPRRDAPSAAPNGSARERQRRVGGGRTRHRSRQRDEPRQRRPTSSAGVRTAPGSLRRPGRAPARCAAASSTARRRDTARRRRPPAARPAAPARCRASRRPAPPRATRSRARAPRSARRAASARALEQHGEIRRRHGRPDSSSRTGTSSPVSAWPARSSSSTSANRARRSAGVERRRAPQERHASSSRPRADSIRAASSSDVDAIGASSSARSIAGAAPLELAEPQLRQPEIGPRRRLLGDELGGARELIARVVEQTDFERGQAVIERAR